MTAAATTQPVTTRHTPVSELHPDRGPGAAQRLGKVLSNVALLLISALFAIPLLWVVLASLDPEASLAVKVPSWRSRIIGLTNRERTPSMPRLT